MSQNALIQLLIFGCDIHGWGYAEMTHPNLNLKVVPNVAKCLNPTFYFGCDIHGWKVC